MELKLPLVDAEKCLKLLMRLDYAAGIASDTPMHKGFISNEKRLKLRLLWQNDPEFIENFIRASGDDLSEEEREILRGWKGSSREIYFVVKYYSEYAGFLSFEDKTCYGVLGLSDCIKALLPYGLPCLIQTTLLPYKGRIMWDGLVNVVPKEVPKEISGILEEICDAIREQGEMVTELEIAGEIMVSLMSAEKFSGWFGAKLYPAVALRMALEHRKKSVPALLELLDDILDEYETIDVKRHDFIIALYVLAKMGEPLAFDYIIEFAQLPGTWPEKLFGNVIPESFAQFIVSTYNGNINAIKQVIEDESLDLSCRCAAVSSLLGLIAGEKISRSEGIEYFRTLLDSDLTKNKLFITFVATDAFYLGPNEFSSEMKKLFAHNMIERRILDENDFHGACLLSDNELREKFLNERKNCLPLDDLDAAIDWLYQDGESGTVRNEEKISRNEPCPCESGKKYKRCCL